MKKWISKQPLACIFCFACLILLLQSCEKLPPDSEEYKEIYSKGYEAREKEATEEMNTQIESARSEGYNSGYQKGKEDGLMEAEAAAGEDSPGYKAGYYAARAEFYEDDDRYLTGYDDGVDIGHEEGEEVGYKNGYDAGYGEGYSDGYDDGHRDGRSDG